MPDSGPVLRDHFMRGFWRGIDQVWKLYCIAFLAFFVATLALLTIYSCVQIWIAVFS